MKCSWLATLLLGLATLLLAACMALPFRPLLPIAAVPVSPERETTPALLRIGWTGDPDTLNPAMSTSPGAFTLFDLVYDSLYQLQLDGSITPKLATDVRVSDNGTVWTFTLRDDAAWHDGTPLTAHDVAYALNLYRQTEAFPLLHPYTTSFAAVEALDDTTVVLTLSQIIPNLESQLLHLYVLPEHIWGQIQGEELRTFENREMIGSGPFQLVDYSQHEFVHLAANPAYVGTKPTIEGVIFRTFDTPHALVQALRSGQVDMIAEVPHDRAADLSAAENIAVVAGPPVPSVVAGPPYVAVVPTIFFNQMAPEACPPRDGRCTGHPVLRDRTVRLALAHATDQQRLIDVMLEGFGSPGLTLIPDSMGLWFNHNLENYPYDPALSNQLLDEAGYLDSDGDGVRELPGGGAPLILRMNWSNTSFWAPRMAALLSLMWGDVGVKVEVQALAPAALEAACCPSFGYDVIVWVWGSEPDPHFLLSLMTTKPIASGLNETGYTNPAYDDLFAQQAVTLDPEARQAIVWEMQRLVHDDVVYIIPFYEHAVQAYRTDRFSGWITGAPTLKLSDVSSLLVVKPAE